MQFHAPKGPNAGECRDRLLRGAEAAPNKRGVECSGGTSVSILKWMNLEHQEHGHACPKSHRKTRVLSQGTHVDQRVPE
jgi:hypothetical protein